MSVWTCSTRLSKQLLHLTGKKIFYYVLSYREVKKFIEVGRTTSRSIDGGGYEEEKIQMHYLSSCALYAKDFKQTAHFNQVLLAE